MKLTSTTARVAVTGLAIVTITTLSAGTVLACNTNHTDHKPKVENHKKDCNKPTPTPTPTHTPTPTPTHTPSPTPTTTPSPTPTPTPTPTPGKGGGEVLGTSTVQPTSLPETGATDLAPVLAGAGGLTAGSLAYLRGRKARR